MKYGFIGCGNMGGALARALTKTTQDVIISDPSAFARTLAEEMGCDYGSNEDLVKHFCGGRTWPTMFTSRDAKGAVTNIGEGQCMGAWIGAKIEDGPHAPMTHTLGGALGVDPYLLLNTKDSILSISFQCGFTTLSSFNRTFRLIKGMTPGEYRHLAAIQGN